LYKSSITFDKNFFVIEGSIDLTVDDMDNPYHVCSQDRLKVVLAILSMLSFEKRVEILNSKSWDGVKFETYEIVKSKLGKAHYEQKEVLFHDLVFHSFIDSLRNDACFVVKFFDYLSRRNEDCEFTNVLLCAVLEKFSKEMTENLDSNQDLIAGSLMMLKESSHVSSAEIESLLEAIPSLNSIESYRPLQYWRQHCSPIIA